MMIEIEITSDALWRALNAAPDLLGHAGYTAVPTDGLGTGDYLPLTTGGQNVLQWHGGPEIASEADLLALLASPEWLAHRQRELKTGLVGAMTAPYESAWATVPAAIRLHNPQLLSAANQSRHGADMADLAAALSAAQGAVDAASTVAAAEAAAEAASIPTYRGPEA
jgi:hypothetical protein